MTMEDFKASAQAEEAARTAAEAAEAAQIKADAALVKTAASAGSTSAQMRDGFAAVLRLLKMLNRKVQE